MDREVWWATVHGVAQSLIPLRNKHFHGAEAIGLGLTAATKILMTQRGMGATSRTTGSLGSAGGLGGRVPVRP